MVLTELPMKWGIWPSAQTSPFFRVLAALVEVGSLAPCSCGGCGLIPVLGVSLRELTAMHMLKGWTGPTKTASENRISLPRGRTTHGGGGNWRSNSICGLLATLKGGNWPSVRALLPEMNEPSANTLGTDRISHDVGTWPSVRTKHKSPFYRVHSDVWTENWV